MEAAEAAEVAGEQQHSTKAAGGAWLAAEVAAGAAWLAEEVAAGAAEWLAADAAACKKITRGTETKTGSLQMTLIFLHIVSNCYGKPAKNDA